MPRPLDMTRASSLTDDVQCKCGRPWFESFNVLRRHQIFQFVRSLLLASVDQQMHRVPFIDTITTCRILYLFRPYIKNRLELSFHGVECSPSWIKHLEPVAGVPVYLLKCWTTRRSFFEERNFRTIKCEPS